MFFQIPFRNLSRNRRRTLLGMAIIALGTMMSYVVIGYVDFSLANIRDVTVRQYGNFQIASRRLWSDELDGFKYLLAAETVNQVNQILEDAPEVVAYTGQLQMSGLAYIGNKTKILRLIAVKPGNAALDYNDLVIAGQGTGLQPDDRGMALIGKSFAEEINLKPGDRFTVTASTVSGQFNSLPLEVAGLFSLNNAQAESQVVFVPLRFGQDLLNTDKITKIIAKTANIKATDPASNSVQHRLNLLDSDLQVRTWVQLSDFYRQIVNFFDILFGFITAAVFVLVFFMILQVLTLSLLERTREIGTLRAIGTKRGEIFRIFLMESLILGLLGSLAGVLIGQMFGIGFNQLGLGWTPPGAVEDVPIKLSLTPVNAILPVVATTAATLASALYPSVYSARIQIVEALRTR